MAKNNMLERMLEINTQLEKGMSNTAPTSRKGSSTRGAKTQQELDSLIEAWDNVGYGAQPQLVKEEAPEYSAEAEMERLRQIEANGGRAAVNLEGRHIPQAIVESILNNPLDAKPINMEDPAMDNFTAQLAKKLPKGIKESLDIMKQVESTEKQAKVAPRVNEQVTAVANVDYALIKTIVENVINEKFGEIKQSLNESIDNSNNKTYVPAMKLLNFKDKFYFVDNDDNVFECEMKYKGKKKKPQVNG